MTADEEIENLTSTYGGAVTVAPDGNRYLVLDEFPLGEGWAPPVSKLAVRITGYPEAAVDGFYVPGEVRLANGAQPTSASLTSVLGPELWWAISYHASRWRPGAHGLRSFIGLVQQRFSEVR